MQGRNSVKAATCFLLLVVFAVGCSPEPKTTAFNITIPEGENDPRVWGMKFSNHYDSYLKNNERTKGYSKYRNDDEDRLKPWPFQFVLF